MAVGGLDLESGTEHPFECPGLGGRFHDHQVPFCRVSQSDRLSHNEKRPHGRPTAPTTLNVPARGSVPGARPPGLEQLLALLPPEEAATWPSEDQLSVCWTMAASRPQLPTSCQPMSAGTTATFWAFSRIP